MRRAALPILLSVLVLALGSIIVRDTLSLRWLGQTAELAFAGGARTAADGAAQPLAALPRTIAHAGGGLGPITYSNSMEALEAGFAKGHTAFEVDFQWTSDGRLVLLHDWDYHRLFLFPDSGTGVLSREEFLRLPMRGGLTPMSMESLMEWLDRHPGARIVTDVKSENLRALERIAGDFPQAIPRIIPQIYKFGEYAPVRAMGYRAILLTLYRKPYFDGLVLRFARTRPLAGVVMSAARAAGPIPAKLAAAGIPVFAHTVNDPQERDRLESNGVYGIITDSLPPTAVAATPPPSPRDGP